MKICKLLISITLIIVSIVITKEQYLKLTSKYMLKKDKEVYYSNKINYNNDCIEFKDIVSNNNKKFCGSFTILEQ